MDQNILQQVGNRLFVRNVVAQRKYDTKFNSNRIGRFSSYRIASLQNNKDTIIPGRNVLRIAESN